MNTCTLLDYETPQPNKYIAWDNSSIFNSTKHIYRGIQRNNYIQRTCQTCKQRGNHNQTWQYTKQSYISSGGDETFVHSLMQVIELDHKPTSSTCYCTDMTNPYNRACNHSPQGGADEWSWRVSSMCNWSFFMSLSHAPFKYLPHHVSKSIHVFAVPLRIPLYMAYTKYFIPYEPSCCIHVLVILLCKTLWSKAHQKYTHKLHKEHFPRNIDVIYLKFLMHVNNLREEWQKTCGWQLRCDICNFVERDGWLNWL